MVEPGLPRRDFVKAGALVPTPAGAQATFSAARSDKHGDIAPAVAAGERICRKWLLSGRSTAETCDMRLRGDPENPLDEAKLPHRVAFCQPTDLPFADHVHRFVALNGPQRPVYGSEP